MKKLILLVLLSFLGFSAKAQCSEEVMEAFGATMGIAMYNTYITIGGIADGYVSETYTGDRVQELMGEQVEMLGNLVTIVQTAMNKQNSGLSADDVNYLKTVVGCLNHLKAEAQALSNFTKDNSSSSESEYSANRDKAWAEIENLLGIGEE